MDICERAWQQPIGDDMEDGGREGGEGRKDDDERKSRPAGLESKIALILARTSFQWQKKVDYAWNSIPNSAIDLT